MGIFNEMMMFRPSSIPPGEAQTFSPIAWSDILKTAVDPDNTFPELSFVVDVLLATVMSENPRNETKIDLQRNLKVFKKARDRLSAIQPPPGWSRDYLDEVRQPIANLCERYERMIEVFEDSSFDVSAFPLPEWGRGRRQDSRLNICILLLTEHFRETRGTPSFRLTALILVRLGLIKNTTAQYKAVHQRYKRIVGAVSAKKVYNEFLTSGTKQV